MHIYVRLYSECSAFREQRRAEPLELVLVRHWELNLRPLQEQYILLTTEPSLQPLSLFLIEVSTLVACVSKCVL